jgi:hypothetical protein
MKTYFKNGGRLCNCKYWYSTIQLELGRSRRIGHGVVYLSRIRFCFCSIFYDVLPGLVAMARVGYRKSIHNIFTVYLGRLLVRVVVMIKWK